MWSRAIKLSLLTFFLGLPTLAMSQAHAAQTQAANAPATQAQIAALQQAVQNAQSAGDNAWMLTSAALVLLMTGPGLALFYGGLVRRKNILGTMMQAMATASSAAWSTCFCAAWASRPTPATLPPFPSRPT